MENLDHVILVFLMYSAAMIIFPIFTFFAVKNLLEKEFHITGFTNTAWSVICAVIVVNLIILAYVRRAFKQEALKEEEERASQSKTDENTPPLTKMRKPKYVRVNTLKCTPDQIIKFFRKEGWSFKVPPIEYSKFLDLISNLDDNSFTRDFHIKELLVFPSYTQFYENELYQNGSILLQDKASCLPAFLLKPKPESVTLDMCAAPGMKTTHLSAIMKNKGKIYATELKADRYKVLTDIIESAGCENVTPINMDALKLPKIDEQPDENLEWTKDVEYILVDPSCSGSGIVERVNVFKEEKIDDKRLNKLCGFQFKLLMHALTNFPKAKRIVYSTCSVYSKENEKVIEDALKKLISLNFDKQNSKPKFILAEPLKDTWTRRGSKEFEFSKNYIFSDPSKDMTNGFFVAVFEKIKSKSEELITDQNCSTSNTKKKKEKKSNETEENSEKLIDDNHEEENENSRKSKKNKKRKKSKELDEIVENINVQQEELAEDVMIIKKKKKKRKFDH